MLYSKWFLGCTYSQNDCDCVLDTHNSTVYANCIHCHRRIHIQEVEIIIIINENDGAARISVLERDMETEVERESENEQKMERIKSNETKCFYIFMCSAMQGLSVRSNSDLDSELESVPAVC